MRTKKLSNTTAHRLELRVWKRRSVLAFNEFVHKGIIDLEKFVELCSTNPAKIFKLKNRGTLKAGSIADVTIIDPELEWTYQNAESKSKSKNSPFDGWKFTGGAVATIVGGKIVYQR